MRAYPWRSEPPQAAAAGRVDDAIRAGAAPVLAYASNASPAVLRRKLGAAAAEVLARPVVLRDTDVVFSAHISPHGAIPATLVPSRGTEVDAWLLAIPATAVPALDATEPNYTREVVAGAHAYVSRHGALRIDGEPVALAAVAARHRVLRALAEAELLECVRRRIAPGESPDGFVLGNVLHEEVRLWRSARLRAGV